MHSRIIALLAAAIFGAVAQAGEILRCTAPNGQVMYTNVGCPEKSQAQHVASYVPEANAPAPARDAAPDTQIVDTLLARESVRIQQAQAAGYRQAMSDLEQAQADAQGDAARTDYAEYTPIPGYPLVVAPYARTNGFRPMAARPHSHVGTSAGSHRPAPAAHALAVGVVERRH